MRKRTIIISSLIIITAISASIAISYAHQKQEERDNWNRLFNAYYEYKVNLFLEENKTAKDIDVVFLGDSLTDNYDVKRFYPQYNVLNRGIGGDTTFGVQNRLNVSVFDVKPRLTAMLIGVNNITTMKQNYEELLISFKEKAPEMKVVLLSLTSMTKDWGRNNQLAQENNVFIKGLADKYEFTFVDLYNPLLDPETNELKLEYTIDGGHFTEKGYEVITSVITPVLNGLL